MYDALPRMRREHDAGVRPGPCDGDEPKAGNVVRYVSILQFQVNLSLAKCWSRPGGDGIVREMITWRKNRQADNTSGNPAGFRTSPRVKDYRRTTRHVARQRIVAGATAMLRRRIGASELAAGVAPIAEAIAMLCLADFPGDSMTDAFACGRASDRPVAVVR